MNKFINQIFCENNIILLKQIPEDSIDMIYLDPPFFSQKKHSLRDRNGKEYCFEDSWDSLEHYLDFLKIRIEECYRILKPTGILFFHCDKFASHYIKVALDQCFDYNNFINEIIWTYKRWSNAKKGLQNNHQNIFMYGKSKNYKFNTKYQKYSPTTNIDQILLNRTRDEMNKSVYSDIIVTEKKGVPLSDVWEIPFLNPKAKERVNYPTQKPIELLERLIEISTDETDIILDPFCGSGSTLVAAKLLNRNYIGIDESPNAIHISKSRLENPIKTNSILLKKGIESYIQKKEKLDILSLINAQPIYRNRSVDGILNTPYGLISIKIQDSKESINSAIYKLSKFVDSKNLTHKLIICIEDSDLFPIIEHNNTIVLINIKNLDNIDNIITEHMEKQLCQK